MGFVKREFDAQILFSAENLPILWHIRQNLGEGTKLTWVSFLLKTRFAYSETYKLSISYYNFPDFTRIFVSRDKFAQFRASQRMPQRLRCVA